MRCQRLINQLQTYAAEFAVIIGVLKLSFVMTYNRFVTTFIGNKISWLGGSVVERRSLTGELSLVCTRPAADG